MNASHSKVFLPNFSPKPDSLRTAPYLPVRNRPLCRHYLLRQQLARRELPRWNGERAFTSIAKSVEYPPTRAHDNECPLAATRVTA